MSGRLKGKVVYIAGGTRGLGEAQVRAMVHHGAYVAFGGRDSSSGQLIEADLNGRARYVPHDVTVQSEWSRAIEFTLANFGRLDGLVNNAGYAPNALLAETPDGVVEQTVAVNQLGPLYGMQHAIAPMRANGGGSIVNIGSPCATRGYSGTTVYSGAKAAVIGMTAALAKELAHEQIRVNVVHPGFMATRMLSEAMGEHARELGKAATPLGRVGEPEDICGAVVFLLSDESSFVTGAEIKVDGGCTL